ncbi:hypothetical protein KEM52_002365 [Ascosphaera acerosa]|nr:hypothetical protein KEM52_002365 [Ascosphaera acerosa]
MPRREKQRLRVSVELRRVSRDVTLDDVQAVAALVAKTTEESDYLTLEALAVHLCQLTLEHLREGIATITLEKPSAMPMVGCSEVEVTLCWEEVETEAAKQRDRASLRDD